MIKTSKIMSDKIVLVRRHAITVKLRSMQLPCCEWNPLLIGG